MANANTAYQIEGNPTASAVTTNTQAFLFSNGNAATLTIPAGPNYNGKAFKIRMAGTFTVGATSTTVKPYIYIGNVTTTTTGNANFITSITAVSTNTASITSSNFMLEAECLLDATSAQLNGQIVNAMIYNTLAITADNAVTQVTSVTQGNSSSSGLNFVPMFAFSASSASNVATLTSFEIDQL